MTYRTGVQTMYFVVVCCITAQDRYWPEMVGSSDYIAIQPSIVITVR